MKKEKKLMRLAEALGTRKALESDIERREEELEKIKIRYQQAKNAHRSVDEYIKESQRVMSDQELADALEERKQARADIETIGEELRGAQIAIKQLQKKRRDLGTEAEGALESMGQDIVAGINPLVVAGLDEQAALLRLETAKIGKTINDHGLSGEDCVKVLDDFRKSIEAARSLFV